MGPIFFLSPPAVWGSLTLGWRGLCHSRGALPFFLNALDVHRGSGIPKAAPIGVSDPRLMAFFAIELTQGPTYGSPTCMSPRPLSSPSWGRLTNLWFPEEGPPHGRSDEELNLVVAAYRDFSRAVDGANKMALQMWQLRWQMTWLHAVRAFLLWYAAANAFAACKPLGLIDSGMSMWDFQWSILMWRYFANVGVPAVQASAVHGPVRRSTCQTCDHCRQATTAYVCAACGKHLHNKCFVGLSCSRKMSFKTTMTCWELAFGSRETGPYRRQLGLLHYL